MSLIALEMPYATAMDHEWDDLLGAGGPTPGQEHVFECLLSDLQWPAVQAKLDEKKVRTKCSCQAASNASHTTIPLGRTRNSRPGGPNSPAGSRRGIMPAAPTPATSWL